MGNNDSHKLVYATEDYCDLLFEWVNDEKVRLNSFNSERIKYEEHKKWFKSKIESDDTVIYIFKANNQDIGVIRLEKMDKNGYLINYSIAKDYRKKGYATTLLKLIKEKYKGQLLVGKVKKGNVGSIKAFINAEFIIKKEYDDIYEFYSFNKE
ncbi:GNAT family N-acetyltransferase [Tissierella pigra]|uniref:GNAT family N-acetyltransferase n=1 Tax=Tissierella pigra TaxID=2607614 RepID=A0A6N7XUX0_9FIRM|nr:GNAT family N-acetyltransferase [Tissierella pigra]MSU00118.1 GNAT family N-acetyltransferase [Tissierella pigra]